MPTTNTAFLLQADEQIEQQIKTISETLHNFVENERNGEPFDPLISVAANVIVASKIIHSTIGEVGADQQKARENTETLSLFLSDKIAEYEGDGSMLDVVQALLALASSMSLSFAEQYYEQDQEEEETTTDEL